jgi:CRP-like cAMP-binding protein
MSTPPSSDSSLAPAERPTVTGATAVVLRRLGLHSDLGGDAAAALDRLLGRPTAFEAGALIAEAGDETDLMTVMRSGFACRMSLLPDGRRQIHSLLLPGDTADAETPLLGVRTDNIEALTRCAVWLVPKSRLASLLRLRPDLSEAFAREAAVAAQVAREWVVNIGQRTALERIAHLICEVSARMEGLGLAEDSAFPLPLTQRDIGDAQGLSAVHVNRVLQALRAQGLIRTEGRLLTILDRERLQAVALFDPHYLHLHRGAA